MAQNQQPGSNYRWLIVLVAFYGCCLHAGCLIYAFSLFIKPLQAQFGWDRATITLAFTLQFVCLGLVSPLVGKAADRFGTRMIISSGAVVAALGFSALPLIKTPLHFYLANIIIGIGGSAMGPVPCTGAVSAVFTRKRGLAIGAMSTGIGIGGFIFSPLIGGVLLPNYGWQGGYIGIAIAHLVMVPLALMFIRQQPRAAASAPDRPVAVDGLTDGERHGRLLSAPFYLIATALFLFLFALVGTLQSQVPHLQDIGFPLLTASSALGALGLVSAGAKFFFGWLCDKIHPKTAFTVAALFLIGGIALLSFIRPASPSLLLWAYAIVFGVGIGSWLPIMSMMVSTTFGMASYGLIFGGVSLVQSIGQATGPLTAGFIYDLTGSYHSAFMLFIVIAAASIPVVLGVNRSPVKERPPVYGFVRKSETETSSFMEAA